MFFFLKKTLLLETKTLLRMRPSPFLTVSCHRMVISMRGGPMGVGDRLLAERIACYHHLLSFLQIQKHTILL